MGFQQAILITLSSLTLYISVIHLAGSIRRRHFSQDFFFSAFAFFVFCLLALFTLYLPADLITGGSVFYFRIQVLLLGLCAVSWYWYIYRYFQLKKYHLLVFLVGVTTAIALAGLLLPREVLLKGVEGVKNGIIAGQVNIVYTGDGMIVWRALMELAVMGLSLGSLIMLLANFERKQEPGRSVMIFLLLLLLVSGLNDHLADYGLINSIYIVPYALFLLVLAGHLLYHWDLQKTQKSTRQLFSDAQDWWQVFNKLDLVVVGLNRMGNVVYANPYLLRLTGYSKDELIGKDWFDVALPPDFAYEVQSAFLEIIERNAHHHYKNPITTKSDEYIGIFWYNVILKDSNGKLSGTLSIGVDERNYRREDTSLENALSEAQRLSESFREEMQRFGRTTG